MVRAFIQRLLGYSMGGNSMVLPPVVWKLILRNVHWPYVVSDTLLIVLMWTGIQEVGVLGISTAWRLMST